MTTQLPSREDVNNALFRLTTPLRGIIEKDSTALMDKVALEKIATHLTQITNAYCALLAAHEQEPVGEVIEMRGGLVMDGVINLNSRTYREISGINKMKRMPLGTKFYTHPAPVPDAESLRIADALEGLLWHNMALGNKAVIQAAIEALRTKSAPVPAVYLSPDTEYMAEDAECLAMNLDKHNVPKEKDGQELSLWGRVVEFCNQQAPVPTVPDDTRRMDWLVSKTVNVRQPMAYGSHDLFWSQTISDDWDEEHKTTLREQIDAAMLSGGKS